MYSIFIYLFNKIPILKCILHNGRHCHHQPLPLINGRANKLWQFIWPHRGALKKSAVKKSKNTWPTKECTHKLCKNLSKSKERKCHIK